MSSATGTPAAPEEPDAVPTLQPPSGEPPPDSVTLLDGRLLDLRPLARETCRRYRAEFPDEQVRYGDAGQAWCVHDQLYLLEWAVEDAEGLRVMELEVAWLARVLESRDFPLVRLARSLEIAAEVVQADADLPPSSARRVSRVLARAAVFVASQETFLD